MKVVLDENDRTQPTWSRPNVARVGQARDDASQTVRADRPTRDEGRRKGYMLTPAVPPRRRPIALPRGRLVARGTRKSAAAKRARKPSAGAAIVQGPSRCVVANPRRDSTGDRLGQWVRSGGIMGKDAKDSIPAKIIGDPEPGAGRTTDQDQRLQRNRRCARDPATRSYVLAAK